MSSRSSQLLGCRTKEEEEEEGEEEEVHFEIMCAPTRSASFRTLGLLLKGLH
jgi:hypothetical protein